jgi:catalase
MTTVYGAPIGEAKYSLTAGLMGPVLMQDYVLTEKINHFATERTPPRNVHALGFGAFGKFTVTNDITNYCSAAIFNKVGNTCETFTRFSGVFTERGDPDTFRDLRGWATKFYTTEGNWDMLTVNTPAFNARDMKVGPDAVHAFKRDPRTGNWNSNQTWDFVATHPEALHTQLMIYTDRVGTPKSFRMQNFFPCNTFSMINSDKERFWVRFHLVSQQGWEGMTRDEAQLIAGEDPNFLSREMKEAIEKGMYPKWKMFIQVMKEEEGYQRAFTFDCTKVWKHGDYPLIEVGVIEVNRWPNDFHSTSEVVAFSPARVVPGIGFSPDRLLQGRIPLYDATQMHRLGPNHQQLPINCPFASKPNQFHAFQGPHPTTEYDKNHWPHYYPSLFGSVQPDFKYKEPPIKVTGPVDYYPFPNEYSDADIYEQPRDFLAAISKADFASLVENLGYALSGVDPRIIDAVMVHFNKIDATFGQQVSASIKTYQTEAKTSAGRAACKKIRGELGNPATSIVEKQSM